MADPNNEKPRPLGNYSVGYKKPPVEHQFKPGQLRDSAQNTKGGRKENPPDVAGMIEKSVQVKRGGKTITMHPFEAEVTSLGSRALKGEAKLFLKNCDTASLLNPPPAQQTHGVFEVPKDVNAGIVRVLLENYGLPPWDSELYAALEARISERVRLSIGRGCCDKSIVLKMDISARVAAKISISLLKRSQSPKSIRVRIPLPISSVLSKWATGMPMLLQ
jgi:hypothetical protein